METDNYSIDLKLWNRFKEIEPIFTKGSYYNNVLTWFLDDFKKDEIVDLALYLHILSRTTTKEDISENGISILDTYYHLFRRSFYDNEYFYQNYISLGYKKPFGNNYIHCDIADCVDPQYIQHLKDQGMDILNDPEDEDTYLIEVPYVENDEFEKIEIDAHKINVDFVMQEFNNVLIEIIQKVDFKYHQFEIIYLNTFNDVYNRGILSDIQANNSVNLGNGKVMFPSRVYNRDEIINNVLK